MNDPSDRCDLCGRPAQPLDPLVPDEFYPDVRLHLHCLNSPAGKAWTERRADADPGYARYLMLITVGHEHECPACGSVERISPRAIGMSAANWEVPCDSCHRYRPLLNADRSPAERELIRTLRALARDFAKSPNPDPILARVEGLALRHDSLLPAERCVCGGTFSLAARPRCSSCQAVLVDSPFHFTLPRPGA